MYEHVLILCKNMNSLAMDGRWIMYGSMGGLKVENANFTKLLLTRGRIMASTLRNRSDDYKADLVKQFSEKVMPDFETGKLKPIIDKVFNLSEVGKAHQYIESNASVGKVLLRNDL